MSLAAAVLSRRVLASVLLVLLAGAARASEPWRAVARVASAEDAALLERVRGQSSDLPVALVTESGAPLDGAPASRWRAAEQLAKRHEARAVLSFLREGPDVRVQVAGPASRHLFVRSARLAGRPGSLEWSAGAEALALAVRSAPRAVDAGQPLGEVLGAGAVAFSRGTEALTPEVEAEPSSAMLALLLGRPALAYAIDGNFMPRGDGWAVRPRLGLAMRSSGSHVTVVSREAEDPRIQAAIQGRREATESPLVELLPRVRNLVRYLVRGDADVDDIAQEGLIALMRGLPDYRSEGRFNA